MAGAGGGGGGGGFLWRVNVAIGGDSQGRGYNE